MGVVLRKSLGSFRADPCSGGTLGLFRAQMINTTSTSGCSESWAAATEGCSPHICFLYLEGFKLDVLSHVAIAEAFELSGSLTDPMEPLFSQMFELKGAASKLRQTVLCRGGQGKAFRTHSLFGNNIVGIKPFYGCPCNISAVFGREGRTNLCDLGTEKKN